MAGVAGVEPTWMVLETIILPLNYTPNSIYKEYNTKKNLFQHFYLKPYYNIGDFMAIIKYTTKEKELLARLMRAEAIGEGDLGMLMVGNVIVNRALADCLTFKNVTTISKVVYQSPGGFSGTDSPLFFSNPTSKELELAERIIRGEYYYPATNALWFYAPSSGDNCKAYWWEQKNSGRYKNHCFYEPDVGVCKQIH